VKSLISYEKLENHQEIPEKTTSEVLISSESVETTTIIKENSECKNF
jgi:hypothetical protein